MSQPQRPGEAYRSCAAGFSVFRPEFSPDLRADMLESLRRKVITAADPEIRVVEGGAGSGRLTLAAAQQFLQVQDWPGFEGKTLVIDAVESTEEMCAEFTKNLARWKFENPGSHRVAINIHHAPVSELALPEQSADAIWLAQAEMWLAPGEFEMLGRVAKLGALYEGVGHALDNQVEFQRDLWSIFGSPPDSWVNKSYYERDLLRGMPGDFQAERLYAYPQKFPMTLAQIKGIAGTSNVFQKMAPDNPERLKANAMESIEDYWEGSRDIRKLITQNIQHIVRRQLHEELLTDCSMNDELQRESWVYNDPRRWQSIPKTLAALIVDRRGVGDMVDHEVAENLRTEIKAKLLAYYLSTGSGMARDPRDELERVRKHQRYREARERRITPYVEATAGLIVADAVVAPPQIPISWPTVRRVAYRWVDGVPAPNYHVSRGTEREWQIPQFWGGSSYRGPSYFTFGRGGTKAFPHPLSGRHTAAHVHTNQIPLR